MLPNSCVEIFKSTPGWTQSTCMCATLRWTQLWTRTPPVLKAAPYMWLSSRAMSAPRWSFRLWQLTRRLYLRLAQGKRFAALRYQELSVIDGPSPSSTSQYSAFSIGRLASKRWSTTLTSMQRKTAQLPARGSWTWRGCPTNSLCQRWKRLW